MNQTFQEMWFDDPLWRAAARAALVAAKEFDWVLAPAEFHGLGARFRPLEYSECAPPGRLCFVCHKDFASRLATGFRTQARYGVEYLFANEVFVLGALHTRVAATPPEVRKHLGAWFEKCERLGDGSWQPLRRHSGWRQGGRKALLVGAAGLGNVGDDLLADAVARQLLAAGLFDEVDVSSFELPRSLPARYDAVVVGGGGLLYASQEGELDYQNLANYLRLPFWCAEARVPCHLFAVGHQESARVMEADPASRAFAGAALRLCATASARDQETAQLIRRLTGRTLTVGADPVWAAAEWRGAGPDSARGPLFIGELGRYPAVATWIGGAAVTAHGGTPAVGIMSDDDLPHAEAFEAECAAMSLPVERIDLRGRRASEIAALLAEFDPVVTSRFHGLVLGALAERQLIVLDRRGGKKERLLRGHFPELLSQWLDHDADGAALGALLAAGQARSLRRPDRERTLAHARTAQAHVMPLARTPARTLPARHADDLLDDDGAVRLCWAAAWPGSGGYANLGDALSAFVVANLAGRPVRHTGFEVDQPKLVAVGSIGHAIRHGRAVIWGTGCYRPDLMGRNVAATLYDIRAVRGPISRECLGAVGVEAPAIYGEPVWMLPAMLHEPVEKRFELGVITHIGDLKAPSPDASHKEEWSCFDIPDRLRADVVEINTWHAPTLEGMLEKLRLIRSCKRIASRSFHGVVIAEAYGIPCLPLCSKPNVPEGAFTADSVPMTALDRRTLEFFRSGASRVNWFFGQRRTVATDWERLIREIDRVWSPLDYDPIPLIDSFPLPLTCDPSRERVPVHPSLETISF